MEIVVGQMPGMSYIGGSYYGDEATPGDIDTHVLKPPTFAQIAERQVVGTMAAYVLSGVVRGHVVKGEVVERKVTVAPASRTSTANPKSAATSGVVEETETTGGYYG